MRHDDIIKSGVICAFMKGVHIMAISYNGLWKLMIDKGLQKKDLIENLNISSTTIAKMGKGEAVSINVLERICGYVGCDIGDIMTFDAKDPQKEEIKE